MLYTDRTNPTSNKIYQTIGYRPVGNCADLALHPVSRRLARLGSSARMVSSRSRSRSATVTADHVGRLGHHRSPRVDDHAAAEAAAARIVVADLSGGEHVALVLDGPGAQQHLPVVAPGVQHEGGRHHQH